MVIEYEISPGLSLVWAMQLKPEKIKVILKQLIPKEN